MGSGAYLARAEEAISFDRQVRPILSDKCFACHGPEEASREGGFRLDVQESAFGEADSGLTPNRRRIPSADPAEEFSTRGSTAERGVALRPH